MKFIRPIVLSMVLAAISCGCAAKGSEKRANGKSANGMNLSEGADSTDIFTIPLDESPKEEKEDMKIIKQKIAAKKARQEAAAKAAKEMKEKAAQ